MIDSPFKAAMRGTLAWNRSFAQATYCRLQFIHSTRKQAMPRRIPSNVNNRVELGTEFTPSTLSEEPGTSRPTAPITEPGETSTASLPPLSVRTGHANLQRFDAIFGGQTINHDVSTPEGVERYKAAVQTWVNATGSDLEKQERKTVEECIHHWLAGNNPELELNLSGFQNIQDLPPLPSTLQHLNAYGIGIANLPKNLPSGLVSLNLSESHITDLPELPDTLQALNIGSADNLRHFPEKWPSELMEPILMGCPGITSLPKNWPETLQFLDISQTEITEIPKNWPSGVQYLNLNDCHNLTSVPKKWPETLTSMDISHTGITEIPKSWPSRLEYLGLSGCGEITSVPESWPETLKFLSISDTGISEIPKSWPSRLEYLNLSNCHNITSVPKKWPETLTSMDISHTGITEIPDDLPNTLSSLDISYTPITEIPESLLQAVARLENPCEVHAEGTSVWEQIALHSNTHPLGVENEYGVARTSLTLHQAVQAWYDTPDASRQAAWEKIHQEVQGAAFTDAPFWTFLDSLKGSEEYPDKDTEEADAMRIVFRKRVTDLLDAIQENKELRSKCFMIADDAVETCHDKVALGFEDMELEHLQMRAAQGEFGQQELFRLGGSYFKLAVLDALAIEKAYQSGNADEAVEVKLAYRTKLADALDLPTKTRAMRYDESAKITDDDLAVAQENVRMATEDNDRLVNFLANWSPWQKDLERHYRPDQFKYSRADLEAEQERIQQEVADLNDKEKNPDLKEWERKEQSDALMEEFHNLENTLFGDDWKRLTQEFMAGRLPASSETA